MMDTIKYFFVYEKDIPDDMGFRLFGACHFCWLAVLAALAAALLYWYVKLPAGGRRRWEYIVSFSMVVWIILRAIYIAAIGENFLYELPLHLCSITGILCAVHCVFRWDWLGQVLYAIGLPGTVLALIFPNWGSYPAIHFITIEGFLFHAGIVLYVFSQLYSHGIVPRLKKMWQVILFLIVVVTPVYFFDRAYHVNYMFVNGPSAGSPLELLADIMGNPGYLVGYAGLILLCIFLMLLGYRIVARKE